MQLTLQSDAAAFAVVQVMIAKRRVPGVAKSAQHRDG